MLYQGQHGVAAGRSSRQLAYEQPLVADVRRTTRLGPTARLRRLVNLAREGLSRKIGIATVAAARIGAAVARRNLERRCRMVRAPDRTSAPIEAMPVGPRTGQGTDDERITTGSEPAGGHRLLH